MKHQAILNLAPNALLSVDYGEDGKEDIITWDSPDIPQPSDAAIDAEIKRMSLEASTQAEKTRINQHTEAEIFSVLGAEDKMGSIIAQLNVMGEAIRMVGYKVITGEHLPDAIETLTAINNQQEKLKALIKAGREEKKAMAGHV
jgi:hypothetical protein